MNKEKAIELGKRFPSMFKDKSVDGEPMAFVWGGVPPGWEDLVVELTEKIHELAPETEVRQVKEKFGGLRYYIGHSSDEVFDLIHKYEDRSFRICEICGYEGDDVNTLGMSWIRSLCPEHRKQYLMETLKEAVASAHRQLERGDIHQATLRIINYCTRQLTSKEK